MPEGPLEQERFEHQLIATTRSLKKKQQQLQADQDLLNARWTNVLAAEEYGLERPTKSYPKRKPLPQFDDEAPEPRPSTHNAADRPPRGRDKAATQAEHQPAPPRRKGRDRTARGYTYDLRQDLDNRAGHTRSIYIYSDMTSLVTSGPKTADGLHRSYVAMWPDIEAPHTPFASLTK